MCTCVVSIQAETRVLWLVHHYVDCAHALLRCLVSVHALSSLSFPPLLRRGSAAFAPLPSNPPTPFSPLITLPHESSVVWCSLSSFLNYNGERNHVRVWAAEITEKEKASRTLAFLSLLPADTMWPMPLCGRHRPCCKGLWRTITSLKLLPSKGLNQGRFLCPLKNSKAEKKSQAWQVVVETSWTT